ncbi:glycoside hydrolase family 43 protein [Naasia sp. SYSU D00948]|uniref:glycoside hydrolase family 43 protein n=1 Tax=Naasia sp. SYSU D00948 TaxID=2817379 RepID=UPI001B30B5F0|nr:glycoside hydrolase family 43 protein [Naasia sp. SYSU D00948]
MSAHPILPGYHPDPSICRVGDRFYLINSSFEYFPGVPVFTSTDLLTWEQIGNVLDRPSQLNVQPGLEGASKGIYAPTIRHHDGRFWMITTNIADIMRGHLIVSAADPAGDWSDPVYTTGAWGMDPDLAWDDDGTCYLTWANPMLGLQQAQVDPASGRLLSEPQHLWEGTGLADPEGPHLLQRNGWWYLVVAEGGTDRGHAVSVARSRTPGGPFEGHPANPIFSHRSTPHLVQSTGHADLVELADGEWAMVYLGVRPRGSFPRFHVNGRETFLAGVDWIDDWPVVVEDHYEVRETITSFVDDFSSASLDVRWISPGVDPRSFTRSTGDGVRIEAGRSPKDRQAARLLAVRARDAEWTAAVTVPDGDAAFVVRIDDAHWAAVERVADRVSARLVVGPLDQVLGEQSGVAAGTPLVLRAVADGDRYSFRRGPDRLQLGYRDGDGFRALAEIDGRYLSTEVAGGFTGRVIGVEALGRDALLTRFEYTAGSPADNQENIS